jgi:hypothetical protein
VTVKSWDTDGDAWVLIPESSVSGRCLLFLWPVSSPKCVCKSGGEWKVWKSEDREGEKAGGEKDGEEKLRDEEREGGSDRDREAGEWEDDEEEDDDEEEEKAEVGEEKEEEKDEEEEEVESEAKG